jgi:hypothetical protein
MVMHHRRIKEMVSTYGITSDLDPNEDVLVSAVRADLIDGERLDAVLDELERALRNADIDEQAIFAVKNIVMELAGNIFLHGTGARREQELLVVNRHGDDVHIWLFGYGLRSEVERLISILREIAAMADPPHHSETLLRRRNHEVMRRAESVPSKLRGGGVGMLTIAALSSKPLWFKLNAIRDHSSFVLRSTVQAAST